MTRYFAYGSNMDPIQMEERCPGSVPLGPATLADHRLTFTYDSARWAGGVGHVIAAPGEVVWGVVWELTDAHMDALDLYESVAQGIYKRDVCDVTLEQNVVTAVIYLAMSDGYNAPSARYVRSLIRGAKAYALPDGYIQGLRDLLPVKGTSER